MKKFLALTLSLLMIFSLIPLTLTASATSNTVTLFTMDDGSRSSYASVTAREKNLTYVDSGEDDYGYVMKVGRTSPGNIQDQAIFIKMPANLYTGYGNITSISFEAKTDSGSFYATPFSLTAEPNNSAANGFEDYMLSLTNGNKSATFGTAWKTYTINMTTANAKSAIARGDLVLNIRNTWSSSNTCSYIYLDNFKITYDYFNATFTGTTDVDGQVEVDENKQVVLPTGTLADGEFGGWVTEDDYVTVIPAGTTVTLAKDTTYIAVASERTTPEAPEAPTVASKTGNSITLNAVENCEYSKDGTTWQDSPVFSGLSAGTEYTFYQRFKATSTAYASPASEGTTVATNVVYKWNLYSTYFSINSGATLKGGFNTQYSGDGTYFVSQDNAVGATATLTSVSKVKSGVYAVKLYSRAAADRALIDVSINNTVVAKDFNTGKTTTINNLNYGFELDNVKIVAEDQPITLTITVTDTSKSKSLFLNSIELTKIADVEKDGLTTDAVSTDDKASIRLTEEGGIRFYTTFDESKVTGTVEEIGTLIGPVNLIGDYLTFEDEKAGNAVAVPYLANTLWENNQFVGSIAKIKTTNYTRDFVARGYVKVDGVYYYSATTATRNVRFVADSYIADPNGGYADLDEATKAVVDKFATPKAE